MITVSYNAYCAISKEGDNDIWTVRPRGVSASQIDIRATVNALLGDTFSRENNTQGSRFHDRDPQFASRILGAMTQSCYIGTRDIRSRVIRGPYCIYSWYLHVWNGVAVARNPPAYPAEKRSLGENLVTDWWMRCSVQVRLCTEAGRSLNFVCFEISPGIGWRAECMPPLLLSSIHEDTS